jgi:hypothetical protein
LVSCLERQLGLLDFAGGLHFVSPRRAGTGFKTEAPYRIRKAPGS